MQTGTLIAAIVFSVLWVAEILAPFYVEFAGNIRAKISHDARNFALGVLNAVLTVFVFGALLTIVVTSSWGRAGGLMALVSWPAAAETALALVVFDLWMYLWHRANHTIPFLWRFHRMHHSETHLDATSGLRFHPGEIFLSGLARLVIVPLLGMTLWQLVLYEAILFPVVMFHHSNVRFSRWIDRGLLVLIVTPAMHRVHHSRYQPETDSNYGSVLPVWDRLFRSFCIRDAADITPGLDEFAGPEWQTVSGMLKTPGARKERKS